VGGGHLRYVLMVFVVRFGSGDADGWCSRSDGLWEACHNCYTIGRGSTTCTPPLSGLHLALQPHSNSLRESPHLFTFCLVLYSANDRHFHTPDESAGAIVAALTVLLWRGENAMPRTPALHNLLNL